MADESTNKTISSTNSGYPAYLNFDTLRSDAIAYLGNLTGKIWTDYNAHDPGITILETLIYAVLDLGYRTNLPIADLLTRAPDDTGSDNNFFTASQILTNNPLTITDYRKLLIDIDGVKNAWLEVDDNTSVNFCKPNNQLPGINVAGAPLDSINLNTDPCSCDYLNGLYHVFIELENDFDTTKEKDKDDYDTIIENVKCALMSHRNLCEDFIDIKVLCKLKVGLCADIELQTDVNPSDVYLQILETLRAYFSPQPKFYTLPQLLDKGKPIDEIFAGRPYNVKKSYGFVDTDEFEAITLRKKLHLSDVYHVLFDIDGVKTVRNLAWKLCNNSQPQPQIINKWELQLPEDFIPELDVTCSGFQFFKNGIKISVDTSKANSVFAMNFSANGKILYRQPSPNLDTEIPQGVYRSDLADYRSIQNEFPHVYGIKEGDLPLNATNERKAQALQLQGFLLFFDQLLANYLTQLKNIRSLFALSSADNQHTYFINQLTDVPQLNKLLRFSSSNDSEQTYGTTGSILVFPTDRKNLESLIASGKITNTDLDRRCNDVNKDDFPPYKFCYATDCEEAENQLRDDFLYGNFNPVVIANYNNCYFFYCFTSSNDFALISKKYYSSAQDAQTAAASIIYLATFPENYRSFSTEENGTAYFSFDLELNLSSYANYLQLICENTSLYNTRRQDFLSHLLSRFAESFTDFALLNADLSATELQTATIAAEEAFLTHYDDISSNRGKAFNYQCDIAGIENISGFEKRFKALCGIETFDEKDRSENLCNFIVEQADEIYRLSVSLFGSAFSVQDKKVTYEAGYASLNSLYKKLANNPTFNTEYLPAQQQWSVFIKDDFGNKYSDSQLFANEQDADAYRLSLQSTLAGEKAPDSKVFVSEYVFQILLKNNANEIVEESAAKFETKEDAANYFNEILPNSNNVLHDAAQFSDATPGIQPGDLLLIKDDNGVASFIDKSHFEFKPVDFIQLESVKKKFALLDDKKTFQFDSLIVYDDETQAEKGFEQLLTLLTSRENYFTEKDTQENKIKIIIKSLPAAQVGSFTEVATYFQNLNSEEEANGKIDEIFKSILTEVYSLQVSDPIPDNWEFKYELANPTGTNIEFYTNTNFKSEQEAQAAANQFYNNASQLQINKVKNDLQLSLNGDKSIVGHAELPADQSKENADAAKKLLEYHRDFLNTISDTANAIVATLNTGKDAAAPQYVYKLVDKNHLRAISNLTSGDLNTALSQKNNLISYAQAGYDYTTILFGNDAILQKTDPATNTTRYHFVIKCSNVLYQTGDLKGQPLVMFESVQGYTSAEDAQNAFLNIYLPVLRKAHDDANYGPNKAISLTEIFDYNTSGCNINTSGVFVPAETLYEYAGNTTNLIAAMVTLAKSYPVLYIEDARYRFTLFNKNTGLYDWRSVDWFATSQEAMLQFRFFLSLLDYAGNYYIEENDTDCHFRIYIREVLAISINQFASADDAWGINGVEKFICVAQSEKGFHNYLNQTNCSNSFFVACGNTGLVHPCKYETAGRRDAAMNTLFKAGSFNFFDHIQADEKGNISLSDLQNTPVANIILNNNSGILRDNCEQLIAFVEAVYDDKNYVQKENVVYLTDENKNRIATPVSDNLSWTDWKKQLQAIACYFPVFELNANNNNIATNQQQCNFYVQIKLPGFNNCADDLACGCADVPDENDCKSGCYLAWKSDCCFATCCDALRFYLRSIVLLQNFSNYKSVYECDCGNFGIELHADALPDQASVKTFMAAIPTILNTLCTDNQNNNNDLGRFDADRFFNICDNQIVAINPQQYSNASEACDAVVRAKELINEQGLHLVEHILLRPRCKNVDGVYEDCNCEYLPKPCMPVEIPGKPGTTCHFKWIPTESDDPCNANKATCFTPGCDPYSFIATIALPAWPERFRSPANKALIEKMLQTEAPAHVLLRIVWLKPRDLCCFEFYCKKWHHWLAKKMCDPQYSNCDFLGLLFHKEFEALDECDECVPCSCNDGTPVTCFEDKKERCADFNLTEQLNNLYCWNSNDFDSYPCENIIDTQIPIPISKEAAVAVKPDAQPKNDTIKTLAKAEDAQPAPATQVPGAIDDRKKNLILQARSYKYLENIKKIVDAKPGNKTAENALRFLSDMHPDAKRYDDLINKILKNKPEKSKNIKGLTLKEKNILIDNVSWQYFDRVCLNEKKADAITIHDALFNHLRKNKIDMKLLYQDWNSKELKPIEPGINFNKIKTVLT